VPVTVFIEGNVIYLWLYTAHLFFVLNIKLVNKEKEITKTMYDSVNHIHFPKEDHLPDWIFQDKHGNKADHVEYSSPNIVRVIKQRRMRSSG